MTREQGNAIRWFLAVTLGIVAGWLWLKDAFYRHFQYAYDLFSSLEMSRSWLDGHVLLYEARYGDHSRIHNYYFHLLLSPFTATLGAFGLFLPHALLLALCLCVVLWTARHAAADRQFHLAVWTLTFFLGPYAFWIWDDPFFGWHVELTYVPMAVIFGWSLTQERLWPKLLAGGLLVSMREDGCVVACCVHLFWYWAARMGSGMPGSGRRLVRMGAIATGWLLVFGAGMGLLAYRNGFQDSRVGVAFSEFRGVPGEQVRDFLGTMAQETLAMHAPLALFAALFFKPRYLFGMLVLTVPLLVVGLVASLYSVRTGTTWFGLAWNPRFAMVLGFQFSCMVYMIMHGEHARWFAVVPQRTVYAAVCLVLALGQWHILKSVRHYGSHIANYVRALSSAPSDEVLTLKRLAAELPRETYVAVPPVYQALFEWHRYVWIEEGALAHGAVAEPDVVIVLETDQLQAVDASRYAKHRCGELTIWHKPSVKLDLSWCGALAQVRRGHAVVLWRQPDVRPPAGVTLVDPAGVVTDIQGLAPETVGSGALDGAQSVLVTDRSALFVGSGLDNREGAAPGPLHLRRISLRGDTVRADETFATLMTVPPGEAWHVADLKERSDGTLLVAATRTPSASPTAASAAFLVGPDGGVSVLSPAAFPPGSLAGIADAGDRWIGAFLRGTAGTDVEVVSFPFSGGSGPFRLHEFRDTAGFGSMDVDVDGSLILVLSPASPSAAAVVRLPHAPDVTPTQVAPLGGPARAWAVNPASGDVATFGTGSPLREVVDISVMDSPRRYGTASGSGPVTPYLGTFGGPPALGNGSFGVRVGGAPGAAGLLLLGVGRAEVPTRFGRLLLDPAGPIVVLAPVALSASGSARVPLPVPADPTIAGGTVTLQAALLSGGSPLRVDLTPGLELVIR